MAMAGFGLQLAAYCIDCASCSASTMPTSNSLQLPCFCTSMYALQARTLAGAAADAYLWAQSWVVSGLHFAGLVKPNPAVKQEQQQAGGASHSAGEAVAATAQTARAAVHDPSVIKQAVEGVAENMANVAKVGRRCCCAYAGNFPAL